MPYTTYCIQVFRKILLPQINFTTILILSVNSINPRHSATFQLFKKDKLEGLH